MRRLRWSLAAMIIAISVMIIDLVRHTPLTMTLFLSVGFGCAGLAIVFFVLDVVENFRVDVTVRQDGDRGPE